ncbi:hypothetical protein Tco_0605917 [Tanacetum coccineum]
MNNLESDDEAVDTPLVSPFPHSDNDSDDEEVLNELSISPHLGWHLDDLHMTCGSFREKNRQDCKAQHQDLLKIVLTEPRRLGVRKDIQRTPVTHHIVDGVTCISRLTETVMCVLRRQGYQLGNARSSYYLTLILAEGGDEQEDENGDDYEGGNGNGGVNGNGNGGGNGNGNGNGNGGGNGYGNHNVNFRGFMPVARECTFQDFLKCQPLNFNGMEGVVGLTCWFDKMETVFHISNCTKKYQVKYAYC